MTPTKALWKGGRKHVRRNLSTSWLLRDRLVRPTRLAGIDAGGSGTTDI